MRARSESHAPPDPSPAELMTHPLSAMRDPRSPGLPEGVWRDQFLEIIIEAHRRALRPADQAVLRFYAQHTRPEDWSAPGVGPICYVGQLNAAERLHLDRKSVYNAECRLAHLGLITKTALGNGHRRGPRGLRVESAPLGIQFAPAIQCYDELVARVEAARADREALTALRYRVSGLRTRLRMALRDAAVEDSIIEAIETAFDRLPTQIARIHDLAELMGLETTLTALLDDLGEHIDAVRRAEAANHRAKHDQMGAIPHKRAPDSPDQIYTTTNSSSVDCTPRGAPSLKLDMDRAETRGADRTAKRHWKKPDLATRVDRETMTPAITPQEPVNWTIAQLLAAAGPDFAFCLKAVQPCPQALTSADFVDAAHTLAGALGINQSAWAEACAVMGRFEAALALLVLDRNRTHPVTPVRSPGGALRGMSEKARAGELRLDASLFSILRRSARDTARPQ